MHVLSQGAHTPLISVSLSAGSYSLCQPIGNCEAAVSACTYPDSVIIILFFNTSIQCASWLPWVLSLTALFSGITERTLRGILNMECL